MERLDELEHARRGLSQEPRNLVERCHTFGVSSKHRLGVPRELVAEGAEHAATASTTIACSSRSFADARSSLGVRAILRGSPERAAEPASGFERTSRPKRDTSSSGDAPTSDAVVGRRGERVGVRIDCAEPMREPPGVERPPGIDLDRPGEHDLAQPPCADAIHRVRDRAA